MNRFLELVSTRLVPAGLTAAGVALVTAGLLTYTDPTIAGIAPAASPTATSRPATPSPSSSATLRPTASASPSAPASAEPTPGGSPTFPPDRTASRIAIPALRVDLPVIRPPNDGYPLCDVALIHEQLAQPGEGRGIYIYGHAREGMFLPLLEASLVRNGRGMLGMIVQVWTTDEQLYLYEITEVRRHQTDLDDAISANHEQLWLQTSEGPKGTIPKLQVVAEPLSSGPAVDPEDAHPTPKPRVCG